MEIWNELISVAIHAPSPHNVQPWRVKILSENEAELYIDSTRTLPNEDITGSFIILAMGLFIEALRILAEKRGYRVGYELFNEPDWYAPAILETLEPWLIPFAKLSLSPCEPIENRYADDLFLKRRTSRLHLDKRPIAADAIDSLTQIAKTYGQSFRVVIDRGQIDKIMSFNTLALFEDLNSPDYHDEIVQWFRFSDREADKLRDGLDYRCMNTSRAAYWMSARMSWTMRAPILRSVLAKVYESQLGPIPSLGVISGGFWKPGDAIEAGKFLMNFWLETAFHDLYIHPFGNLVTNQRYAAEVEKELGAERIWLIFKIGSSAIPPKSKRLPVEKILVR